MTLRALAIGLLALAALAAPAEAHQALPEPVTGRVVVPAGESVAVAVADLHVGDTLWVQHSSPTPVTVLVRWTGADGAVHAEPPRPAAASGELRFVAPDALESASLDVLNGGEDEAIVEYAYLSTAPFLRSPDLWLPTFAPFLFLGACVALAWGLRPWIARRGAGPVRPPGWEEAQARRARASEHSTSSEQETGST